MFGTCMVITTFILDQDIDECADDAYYCIRENSVNCTNSDGSYTCLCNTSNNMYMSMYIYVCVYLSPVKSTTASTLCMENQMK